MKIPCRLCINPKSCTYRCTISDKDDPDCLHCVVYRTLEDEESTIESLKKEALKYKDKADKYDEIVKVYSEELTKTVVKAFLNTLRK